MVEVILQSPLTLLIYLFNRFIAFHLMMILNFNSYLLKLIDDFRSSVRYEVLLIIHPEKQAMSIASHFLPDFTGDSYLNRVYVPLHSLYSYI